MHSLRLLGATHVLQGGGSLAVRVATAASPGRAAHSTQITTATRAGPTHSNRASRADRPRTEMAEPNLESAHLLAALNRALADHHSLHTIAFSTYRDLVHQWPDVQLLNSQYYRLLDMAMHRYLNHPDSFQAPGRPTRHPERLTLGLAPGSPLPASSHPPLSEITADIQRITTDWRTSLNTSERDRQTVPQDADSRDITPYAAYQMIIKGLSRSGQLGAALDAALDMVRKGLFARVADAITPLLRGCYHHRDAVVANRIWEHRSELGIPLANPTLDPLMLAAIHGTGITTAPTTAAAAASTLTETLIEVYRQQDLALPEAGALALATRYSEHLALRPRIAGLFAGVKPDLDQLSRNHLHSWMVLLGRSGYIAEAMEVYTMYKVRYGSSRPDIINLLLTSCQNAATVGIHYVPTLHADFQALGVTYMANILTMLIRGYSRRLEPWNILPLLPRVTQCQPAPTPAQYHTIIISLLYLDQWLEAWSLYEHLMTHHHTHKLSLPPGTHRFILLAAVRHRQTEACHSALRYSTSLPSPPPDDLLVARLEALGFIGNRPRFDQLLGELEGRSHRMAPTDRVAFASVLVRVGHLKRGQALIRQATVKPQGIPWKWAHFRDVVQFAYRTANGALMGQLVDTMARIGISNPHSDMYPTLAAALVDFKEVLPQLETLLLRNEKALRALSWTAGLAVVGFLSRGSHIDLARQVLSILLAAGRTFGNGNPALTAYLQRALAENDWTLPADLNWLTETPPPGVALVHLIMGASAEQDSSSSQVLSTNFRQLLGQPAWPLDGHAYALAIGHTVQHGTRLEAELILRLADRRGIPFDMRALGQLTKGLVELQSEEHLAQVLRRYRALVAEPPPVSLSASASVSAASQAECVTQLVQAYTKLGLRSTTHEILQEYTTAPDRTPATPPAFMLAALQAHRQLRLPGLADLLVWAGFPEVPLSKASLRELLWGYCERGRSDLAFQQLKLAVAAGGVDQCLSETTLVADLAQLLQRMRAPELTLFRQWVENNHPELSPSVQQALSVGIEDNLD
ncbi:hypothetical protein H4R33_001303 [Dimargaris cristalligena]|uniref:Uncharacterized protein n=1 Tax=Dimargaris cristalligena TaxID=215637 RepID=A0A4P9ZV95_9FUNG|nr:hypothetical protein H4R33_001303 [Dimargaris cristalligena]RKP37493.1 hypothetical protein BJ085DRAFT_38189 [Dimargaris cristalligena]|eukprot:RKP37493.1 hypothetical protein BJ085DRAFT_38189 [Dimargaris cristalligena]